MPIIPCKGSKHMERENPEVLNHTKVISLALFCFCGKIFKTVVYEVADKVTMS
jgi:hypothetical protein